MDYHQEITVSLTTPSKNSIDFITENISSTIENNTAIALITTSTDFGDLKPNKPIIIRGLKNEFIPEDCLQPDYLGCPSPKSLQVSKLKHENSLEFEIEKSDNNIQILENDCIAANTEVLGDIDASFKKEFITEDCLALTNEVSKIEITEHNLELENIQVLEDIYRSYNENVTNKSVSNKFSENAKYKIGKRKKPVDKCRSWEKKKVQKNTLDGFVHKTKHTDKKETENKKKKRISIEKFERLFIRLERIDISDHISNQVCTSSVDDINLSVSTESYVGNSLKTDGNKVKSIPINASKNKLSVRGKKAASKKSALNADTIKENLSDYEEKKKLEGNVPKINKSTVSSGGKRRKKNVNHYVIKQGKPLRNQKNKNAKSRAEEFKCSHCSTVVKYKRSLINHIRQWHTEGERKFKCKSCLYATNLIQAMKYHTYRIHASDANKPTFNCKLCSFKTTYKGSLSNHIDRVHLKKKKMKKCNQCDWEGDMAKHSIHVRTVHLDEEYFCDKCNFKSKTKGRLASHLNVHIDVKKFSCPRCPYQAVCKARLAAHLKIHDNNFVKCPHCMQLVKKIYLNRHLKRYQNRLKEKCSECGREVIDLAKHLLTHTGGSKKIKCPRCTFSCVSSNYLQKHIRQIHENEKPEVFICYHCNRKLVDKPGIILHLKTVHTKDEPCECHICGTKFKSKNYLLFHIRRMHSNCTKWFKCDLCPEESRYKTKRKSRLKWHRVLHLSKSELTMFKCKYCPYESKVPSYLYKHIVKHHEKKNRRN